MPDENYSELDVPNYSSRGRGGVTGGLRTPNSSPQRAVGEDIPQTAFAKAVNEMQINRTTLHNMLVALEDKLSPCLASHGSGTEGSASKGDDSRSNLRVVIETYNLNVKDDLDYLRNILDRIEL